MKLVNVIWFNPESRVIGIVVGEDEVTGKHKAYIGLGAGDNENSDAQQILNHGAPFTIPLQTGQLLKTMGALAPDLTATQAKIWREKLETSPVLHGDKQLDLGLYEELKAFLTRMVDRK